MKLINCHNCDSSNIKLSIGAVYGSCSIFCCDCGCAGASSETEPKCPDQNKRIAQAKRKWNNKLIERNALEMYGGERFYPPIKFTDNIKVQLKKQAI